MKHLTQGFTLIELVVVIVILGILAATVAPKYISLEDNARTAIVSTAAGAIQSTAMLTYADKATPSANTLSTILAAMEVNSDVQVSESSANPPASTCTLGAACGTEDCLTDGSNTTLFILHADDQANISTTVILSPTFCSG
jgi:MSHA pilin protein MshA